MPARARPYHLHERAALLCSERAQESSILLLKLYVVCTQVATAFQRLKRIREHRSIVLEDMRRYLAFYTARLKVIRDNLGRTPLPVAKRYLAPATAAEDESFKEGCKALSERARSKVATYLKHGHMLFSKYLRGQPGECEELQGALDELEVFTNRDDDGELSD